MEKHSTRKKAKPVRPGSGNRKKARAFPKGRQVQPDARKDVQKLLKGKSLARDLLIEHLHLIQDKYGHLSAAHLAALAEEMKLAMAEVYEVATFYHHFDVVRENESAPAEVTIRVCDSLSCEMAGAKQIIKTLSDKAPKYLRTGDLGRLDSDGYLWITGRAKDLIIRGGHNIDPAEIEDALLLHPDVAFAGAIGQPDAHAGEIPCAYVELIQGGKVTGAELVEHCKIHVHERAAMPKHIEVLTELPKTAVGKVFKPDLRRKAITRVFNAALEEAKLNASVVSVLDDKKRGLVAQVTKTGVVHEEEVGHVLGAFTTQWDWA